MVFGMFLKLRGVKMFEIWRKRGNVGLGFLKKLKYEVDN